LALYTATPLALQVYAQLVSDVVEKKHRLVVEVESLASSRKKITTRRREGVGVVVEKMKKVDELSTKIRVLYLQQ